MTLLILLNPKQFDAGGVVKKALEGGQYRKKKKKKKITLNKIHKEIVVAPTLEIQKQVKEFKSLSKEIFNFEALIAKSVKEAKKKQLLKQQLEVRLAREKIAREILRLQEEEEEGVVISLLLFD